MPHAWKIPLWILNLQFSFNCFFHSILQFWLYVMFCGTPCSLLTCFYSILWIYVDKITHTVEWSEQVFFGRLLVELSSPLSILCDSDAEIRFLRDSVFLFSSRLFRESRKWQLFDMLIAWFDRAFEMIHDASRRCNAFPSVASLSSWTWSQKILQMSSKWTGFQLLCYWNRNWIGSNSNTLINRLPAFLWIK